MVCNIIHATHRMYTMPYVRGERERRNKVKIEQSQGLWNTKNMSRMLENTTNILERCSLFCFKKHVHFYIRTLGAIHKGRPAYPGKGGSRKSGHLLLFSMNFYCVHRTHGGGGSENPDFRRTSLTGSPIKACTCYGLSLAKICFDVLS